MSLEIKLNDLKKLPNKLIFPKKLYKKGEQKHVTCIKIEQFYKNLF